VSAFRNLLHLLVGDFVAKAAYFLAFVYLAQKLGISAGSPLMVLDRIVLALDGRPIEWRMGWCHLGDRYYLAEMV